MTKPKTEEKLDQDLLDQVHGQMLEGMKRDRKELDSTAVKHDHTKGEFIEEVDPSKADKHLED